MSDVNLTDTEREARDLADVFRHVRNDRTELAQAVLASEWLAERDARVRAAALAPIQALADNYRDMGGVIGVWAVVDRLDAVVAAAGVDAAPNKAKD